MKPTLEDIMRQFSRGADASHEVRSTPPVSMLTVLCRQFMVAVGERNRQSIVDELHKEEFRAEDIEEFLAGDVRDIVPEDPMHGTKVLLSRFVTYAIAARAPWYKKEDLAFNLNFAGVERGLEIYLSPLNPHTLWVYGYFDGVQHGKSRAHEYLVVLPSHETSGRHAQLAQFEHGSVFIHNPIKAIAPSAGTVPPPP